MPLIIGFGDPSRTLDGNSRKRSESVSGVFPEFLPESPSRTGGVAHKERAKKRSSEMCPPSPRGGWFLCLLGTRKTRKEGQGRAADPLRFAP